MKNPPVVGYGYFLESPNISNSVAQGSSPAMTTS